MGSLLKAHRCMRVTLSLLRQHFNNLQNVIISASKLTILAVELITWSKFSFSSSCRFPITASTSMPNFFLTSVVSLAFRASPTLCFYEYKCKRAFNLMFRMLTYSLLGTFSAMLWMYSLKRLTTSAVCRSLCTRRFMLSSTRAKKAGPMIVTALRKERSLYLLSCHSVKRP